MRPHGGAYDRGWKMYSAERFYDAPLLPDGLVPRAGDDSVGANGPAQPNCSFTDWDARGGALTFTVWNSFKQSHEAEGSFKLTEVKTGHVAAAGSFRFARFWRPTVVAAAVTFSDSAVNKGIEAVLWVNNSRGVGTSRELMCREGGGYYPSRRA